jgi:hypothetical protein
MNTEYHNTPKRISGLPICNKDGTRRTPRLLTLDEIRCLRGHPTIILRGLLDDKITKLNRTAESPELEDKELGIAFWDVDEPFLLRDCIKEAQAELARREDDQSEDSEWRDRHGDATKWFDQEVARLKR